MAESRGMMIIRSGDTSILARASLFDAANVKITAGTTSLRCWHVVPTTGALETYDFNDNTFKAGAITTPTASMTHRQAENSTYDTGYWDYRFTTLTGFTIGDKYVCEVSHASLPRVIQFEFQYGGLEGDEWILAPFMRERNTATGGSANTIVLDAGASASNDYYKGGIVTILTGTGAGQSRYIYGYTGASQTASVRPNWVTNPVAGSVFIITSFADAVVNEFAVWDTTNSSHVAAGTTGLHLNALGAAIAARANSPTLNALLGVPDTAGSNIAETIWDEVNAGHVTAGTVGLHLNALGAAIAARANNPTLNALLGVTDSAGLNISDMMWDENIVAAHGTASTSGLLLRVLGAAISTRTNNPTLNGLLGVPDISGATAGAVIVAGSAQAGSDSTHIVDATRTEADTDYWKDGYVQITSGVCNGQVRRISAFTPATDTITVFPAFTQAIAIGVTYVITRQSAGMNSATVATAVWDEDIVLAHGTANTSGLLLRALGAGIAGRANNPTLNALLGVPDVVNNTIAYTIWDENIVGFHGGVSSAGLLLRCLGGAISIRANNPNLNDLLGVQDAVGADIAWTIWDEDIVAGHGGASTAGLLLRVLGAGISTRANNATLNALLGCADVAGHDVPFETWEEVLDAAHVIADSAAQRLKAVDDLTQAGGAGDLAHILGQTDKLDAAATTVPPTAGSIADQLDTIAALVAAAARDFVVSVNIESTNLHLEVGMEQYGILLATPTQCAAQIIDEAGGIVKTIGVGDFGAMNARNLFTYTWNTHTLVAGQTYECIITITIPPVAYQTTKVFKTV